MFPKDVYVLFSSTCMLLYIADVIKLLILQWGDYLELSGWVQCNHMVFLRKEGRTVREGDVVMEAEVGGMRLMALMTERD